MRCKSLSPPRRALIAAGLVWLAAAPAALAADVQAAVAANFTEPARDIAAAFKARTGNEVTLSFGSSGQFYAQISQGAPFEVFLSADAERPARAESDGLAVQGSRFTYAVGRLALYSRDPGLVDGRGKVLAQGRFDKLAVADPATAPYGAAAVQTLQALGLYPKLKSRLVRGANITQAFQFAQSGAAELGFVAMSQVAGRQGGSRWIVPERLHRPIAQQAVLLDPGRDDPAARAFLAFLKGPEAKRIIRRYGYGTP
jgi:molybdate transport system substrate-binding protein